MKNKNRILYAVHLLNDFSGSPRVLADAIQCLCNDGYDCRILTSQHQGFLSSCDGEIYNIPYARLSNRWIILLCYVFSQLNCFFLLIFFLIKDRLRGESPVVLVNTMLPFGACLAAKLLNVKCVVYLHETSVSPLALKKLLRNIIEFCATHVIFVSNYLAHIEGFKKPNVITLYNGLRRDINFSKNIDKQNKFNKKNILFCGSLKEYKGVYQFFALARRMPKFNFIAALNCNEYELEALNDKVPNNTEVFSRPKDLISFYENSFIVVNMSNPDQWIETFGLSILEGMAAGAPVIAPPVGGPVELVSEGVGLLVDSRNLDVIEDFIHFLASDFDCWCTYSDAALEKSKDFSAKKYETNIVNLFSTFYYEK